ncbi:hypothetical protein RirG_004370 [Rhizophagus irregularis DAOM 197198w]|uniref:tRNA (cytosine(38)-C(5))-methyltransferase n=1 Tax=Rhizophagus irregularis (strain DAOM 197198w) TaxID=1432141 RepID=A0A015M3J1_RHIIW|nr:hypothetical protein RirG_004370 [Rhizophagus irregularis DAOM 197198w]
MMPEKTKKAFLEIEENDCASKKIVDLLNESITSKNPTKRELKTFPLKPPELLSRIANFLPQIALDNKELEKKDVKSIDIENVEGAERNNFQFFIGYHHYVEATGSILQLDEFLDSDQIFNNNQINSSISENTINLILRLKLRYFTEREVASIMGFPKDFSFPEEVTLKQRYRVLGNSLSVRVVAELIKYLLLD